MILHALLTLVLSLAQYDAQDPSSNQPPSRSQVIAAARDVMAAARFCTFITLDASGHPAARMMDPFPPEEDFTIWMATNRSTRKTDQITDDSRATLSCFDHQGVAYVSLQGNAMLVDSPEERQRHFKPEWTDFYTDQFRGDDYVLIRLVPFRLEMVSLSHGIASDPRAWKPAIIDLAGSPDKTPGDPR